MNLYIIFGVFLFCFQCVVAENGTSVEDQWKDFISKFKKTYDSLEKESERFEVFKENCEKFKVHNENETMTFKMGINRDADLTYDEIYERSKYKPE